MSVHNLIKRTKTPSYMKMHDNAKILPWAMLNISTNLDKYPKNNPSFLCSVILQTKIASFSDTTSQDLCLVLPFGAI